MRIYTARELDQTKFPDEPWLIYPTLRRGSNWLVGGKPDSNKSLTLQQLCLYACRGEDYLFWRVDKPVSILYVNADDNERDVQERLRSLNTIGGPLPENLHLICQPGITLTPSGVDEFLRWTREIDPDIVIIDHMAAFVNGGTTDCAGMQMYNNLITTIMRMGKGVISIGHFNKDNKDNKDEPDGNRIAGLESVRAYHHTITTQRLFYQTPLIEKYNLSLFRTKHFKNKPFEVKKLVKDKSDPRLTWIREG